MEITLTTPALLFPAISLLLLAYTNRFLALASLIRSLYAKYEDSPSVKIEGQLSNLRKRVFLIRNMQGFGIASLFLCVLAMFLLFYQIDRWGEISFGISLIFMLISLGLSFREIQISTRALQIQLDEFRD